MTAARARKRCARCKRQRVLGNFGLANDGVSRRAVCNGCLMSKHLESEPGTTLRRRKVRLTAEQIAADVKAFVAAGGSIERLPGGVDLPTHRVGMPSDFLV